MRAGLCNDRISAVDKRIYLSPPWLGGSERTRLEDAVASGWVAPCGPAVDEFERRLAALPGPGHHAAAVTSGTAALDLLMHAFDVGPGTTVIASDLTFISTIGPAVHRGATPVFVDSDPATGTMSVPLLEEALACCTAKRVIVIAADLYGQCCDYDALAEVCTRRNAIFLVDAAEAVGATYRGRGAGSAGRASIYSFNGNKLITTSGGGAVLSTDRALVDRARKRAQQSREPFPWYEHREVGYNYRLSNLLAAVGCGQLDILDEIVRRKRATFDFYCRALTGKAIPFPVADYTHATHWLSVFLYPDTAARDAAAARLTAANIESRPVWKPMHLQPVFQEARVFGGATSADFFNRGICLPSGAGLADKDLERIEACL